MKKKGLLLLLLLVLVLGAAYAGYGCLSGKYNTDGERRSTEETVKRTLGAAKTTEAPAEPASTEAPAEPASTDVPAEPASTDVPAEPASTDVPAEPASTPDVTENSSGKETAARSTAPGFTVLDGEGREVRLSDYFGKPVILNFWATWCGPCRSELPYFNDAFLRCGDEISFLMIDLSDAYSETVDAVKRFLSENGYVFPVYYDLLNEGAAAYGISAIPLSVFIDANGSIRAQHLGSMDAETLERYIKELLES